MLSLIIQLITKIKNKKLKEVLWVKQDDRVYSFTNFIIIENLIIDHT